MPLSPCPKLPQTNASVSGGRRNCLRSVRAGNAAAERLGERGGANLKAIIWTVILVALIYVIAMVVPVLINEYEFQDGMQDIARFATVNRRTNEQLQKAVLEEAQKEDLPVEADDVKILSNGKTIDIDVNYSVTIDLKVYQWTLNFHPTASNTGLL
jgi:heme/copper-type cytochrome/quinol oxidase subunit 2